MVAALRIWAASARCASSPSLVLLPYHFVPAEARLSQDIPQVFVPSVAHQWFFLEFLTLCFIDLQDVPAFLQDFFDSW